MAPITTTTQRANNGKVQLSLAPAPTRRRPWVAIAGVVLVVMGALSTMSAITHASHRVSVLVVSKDVPQGAAITPSDLAAASVSASGLSYLPLSAEPAVLGRRAAVPLLAGSLLERSALGTGPAIKPGEEVVGVALRPGQLPAEGLSPGEHVAVVLVPAPGSSASGAAGNGQQPGGSVLVPDAVVFATVAPSSSSTPSSDAEVVSLLVRSDLAGALAAAGAAGEVALLVEGPQ